MSIGTPHYMSPEQARAQSIDGRSDIYSLGVVAYQALAGTVPYDGEDSFSIGYKHITEPVPVPQLITADERRLFEVIKRMLMKDPTDRYQSCEELLASLQGQPTAAAGSVRASVAAAGVGAGMGPTVPSPAMGGPALIVSQPTTPLDSPLVNRRATPRERRDLPRRVADRSVAMRRIGASTGGLGWLWLLLAIAGGGGGAFYYYSKRGFAPFATAGADSTAVADSARGDSVPVSTPPPPDSAQIHLGPAPRPTDSAKAPAPRRNPSPSAATAGSAATAASADSGGVRLIGLPRGSTVMIDERPVLDAVTVLSAGPHVLAISAPRFNFFTDTIRIRGGDTLELTPELQPARRVRAARRDRAAGRAPSSAGPLPRRRPLRAGPRLQRGRLLLRRAAQAGEPAVRAAAGGLHRRAAALAALGQGVGRGAHRGSPAPEPSDDTTFENAARDFVWTVVLASRAEGRGAGRGLDPDAVPSPAGE